MLKNDVIQHFGSLSNAARALNLSRASVTQWSAIIPQKQAFRVERLSGGKLKVDMDLYEVKKEASQMKRHKTLSRKNDMQLSGG